MKSHAVIHRFRDNSCYEILYLLEDYVTDEKNQTNNLMKRKNFQFRSLFMKDKFIKFIANMITKVQNRMNKKYKK